MREFHSVSVKAEKKDARSRVWGVDNDEMQD
jgi:hypothetical protein